MELMFGRRLQTRLDLLHPNLGSKVRQNQARQKSAHDYHAKSREFQLESEVLARGFGNDDSTWLPGVICEQREPVSFIVKLDDGRIVLRHIDHIRSRESLAHSDSIVREEEVLADAWVPTTPEDALVDPQTPVTNADPLADPSADSLADPQN